MARSDFGLLRDSGGASSGVPGSHIMVVGGHGLWQADPDILASRAAQLNQVAQMLAAVTAQLRVLESWAEQISLRVSAGWDLPRILWLKHPGVASAQDSYQLALRALIFQTSRVRGLAESLGVRCSDLTEQLTQLSCVFDNAEQRARMGWGTSLFRALPLDRIPAKGPIVTVLLKAAEVGQKGAVIADGVTNGHAETVSLGMDESADAILGNPFILVPSLLLGASNDLAHLVGIPAGKTSFSELLKNRWGSYFTGAAARSNTQVVAALLTDFSDLIFPLIPPLGAVQVSAGKFAKDNGTQVSTDTSLSQIISRLDDLPRPVNGEEYVNGHVHLIKHETSAGTSWSVLVQGTQNWSPYSLSPQGLDSDIAAVGGEATTHTAAVLAAMEAAGIAEGDPVELVGHSLGAATVQQLAADPTVRKRFNIGLVTMVGAPALGGKLPASVQGISFRRGNDPVTGMGVKHLPPAANHTVVVQDRAQRAHMADSYVDLAREVEAHPDPSVQDFTQRRQKFLHLGESGDGVVSRRYSFEATRRPGLEQKEISEQVKRYAP